MQATSFTPSLREGVYQAALFGVTLPLQVEDVSLTRCRRGKGVA